MPSTPSALPRRTARRRTHQTVMPLELFFDLVFVLALTQTTQIMAAEPTVAGVTKAMLVLTAMWWSWTAYAWLTSAVDPEEGGVRIALAVAMAALLVAALCLPRVFADTGIGLLFAGAYVTVRLMHSALLVIASRGAPDMRRSILQFSIGTVVSGALITAAAFADGHMQAAIWAVAVTVDLVSAILADPGGWQMNPHHFAERHGLIIIIALGESIVAVGAGASLAQLDPGVVVGAVAGVVVCFVLWWLYFDVVALVATQRLAQAPEGRVRNTMARDSYSYLHLVMVAGIVLMALGLKTTLAHVGEPLHAVPAAGLLGGVALYLVAHVAFRWRNVHSINTQRTVTAVLCVAAVPIATRVPALATLVSLAAVGIVLLIVEVHRHGPRRRELRQQWFGDHAEPAA